MVFIEQSLGYITHFQGPGLPRGGSGEVDRGGRKRSGPKGERGRQEGRNGREGGRVRRQGGRSRRKAGLDDGR